MALFSYQMQCTFLVLGPGRSERKGEAESVRLGSRAHELSRRDRVDVFGTMGEFMPA